MEAFEGEKKGLEYNATLSRKPVQLQEHGLVSIESV